MLARLQQFITLTLLAGMVGWFAWAWQAGRPGLAIAGSSLMLCGHALILGIEFLVMHRVNRLDPTDRATISQLVRAWWCEVISAPRVFCWRQPFRSRELPDRLIATDKRGVVFVHGFVCNRGLWNPWLSRLHAADVPYSAVNLEPVFGSIDDCVPIIEAAVRAIEAATGRPPVIVAHSMGGLALRRWWVEPGNAARVAHALTLGTPHHGTWLARFALSANGRQMRRDSEWLRSLQELEPASRAQQITCFYSHCDNIVFPPATATLPCADNRHLPAVAHVHMADRPEPYDELMRRLQG